ncbi:hypothetical protein HK105_200626 [Polyrhizophydium stewartii]|uniref:EamA domain-containing protein n=1 Tax=Polyrhizophydium stewartii TaxID=2732419 RepID=A0ABR4NJK8_9FUNG
MPAPEPALGRAFLLLLVGGMLFTGTINTLLNKLQDLTCVEHCDDPARRHNFEQPVWQTLNMFIGEAACLLVYYISVAVESHRRTTTTAAAAFHPIADEAAPPTETSPLIAPGSRTPSDEIAAEDAVEPVPGRKPLTGWRNVFFLAPTLLDLTATTAMGYGLIYISASQYQMLRGSVVLFTGLLSSIFLGRRHPLYRWVALVTVFLGVAVVGLSGIVQSSSSPTVSSSPVGIFFVVLAQVFTASQFVIEEMIMARYEVPALKAVGLEGIFGLLCVAVGMPILHYTIGVRGTPGNYFDMFTGFHQVFDNPQVLYAGVGIIFSIAFFNWFGLSVTRHISSTSRSTIDTCRTLFIWIVSLGLGWETFKWLQVVGFAILVYGTFLFNDVVKPPAIFVPQTPQEDAAAAALRAEQDE